MSTKPGYAEFGIQSNFSFLRGASRPEELVLTAGAMGYTALGLADRNSVAGVVRAWKQAQQAGIAYHPGCRLVFADDTPDILAYPQNRQGWAHLCRLLTQANMREEAEKGAPVLYRQDLFEWGEHMSLAILPRFDQSLQDVLALLKQISEPFSKATWLAVAPEYKGDDRWRLAQAASIANAAGLPLMATNDILYCAKDKRPLQDVLTAIRLKTTVAQAGLALEMNAERHMKLPEEMLRLFRDYPAALAETQRFAESLSFSLKELKHNYPDEVSENGLSAQEELERLTWEGAKVRFPAGIKPKHEELIRKELALVETKNYARYFLTVHDIMRFARQEGILCQGRGSAANSLVCYCLQITDVGPDIMDHLLERFISNERDEPPDIDVDFEHDRRDEVMNYIYKKYSGKHTALAASVVSYRGRSALREVAKAMGLSEDVMKALSGSIWGWSHEAVGEQEANAAGLDQCAPLTRHVVERANEIMGFPRHLSQHVGGFVITKDRLDEIVPIVKTAMEERKMIEWDKDDLDNVGLLKVDILALGMLSCLRRCFDLLTTDYGVHDDYGRPYTLATLPSEQKPVYDMISRADTIGVFQVESRAQMSMLPRLQPRKFYDLVIEVAIVRPGPIQGDMVHPYLRRRERKEKPEYYNDELRAILDKTLGVPLFQEQAMRVAMVAGGFNSDEADQLRRAMATFKRTGAVKYYRDKMVEGMVKKGYPHEFAQRCFRQIEGFGEYGFPESHAASFALLVYASAWFKTYYPDIFCTALLNSQPMGFYAPAQLVRDANEHGVEIREPDINFSFWDTVLENSSFDPRRVADKHKDMRPVIQTANAVRLGFRQIKGLSKRDMQLLVVNRGPGYTSVRDLWLRSGLPKSVIAQLAEADAFRSLGLDRRSALWNVQALDETRAPERLPLLDRPEVGLFNEEPDVTLPIMRSSEHVVSDYRSLSLSLKAHPVSFLRHKLERTGVVANDRLTQLRNGQGISIAGLVLIRQRPGTSKGIIFMTIEDETGVANIIVRKNVFEQFRPEVLGSRFIRVTGRLQNASNVIHLIADKIENLSGWLNLLTHTEPSSPQGEVNQDRMTALQSHPQATSSPTHVSSLMPKGRNFH